MLLGLEGEERQHYPGDVEAWPSCVLPYLPSLQAEGLPASPQELGQLGRWVLDSVRYDFFSRADETGATSTRLWIRMPTIIHDQTANEVGQLLRDAISPVVARKVTACSMKCEFSDRFQRMLAEQKPTGHPVNTRLRPRNAEAKRRRSTGTEGTTSRQQQVAILHSASTRGSAAGAGAAETQQGGSQELEEEKGRYEEAQPDVCIFVGSMAQDLFPPIIVEVGFSHPLPPDRARSFIYGSDGRCRVVICLDIEYWDKEKRSRQYEAMETQGVRRQEPPYGIVLNLFRREIEEAPDGRHDTYAAKHALRNVDVREAARLGQTLELRSEDLMNEEEEEEEDSTNAPADTTGPAKVIVPYADLVKVVDEAAWCMAVREHPSLQQQRKRKRVLMPKLPSASPEPEADDAPVPKKQRQKR